MAGSLFRNCTFIVLVGLCAAPTRAAEPGINSAEAHWIEKPTLYGIAKNLPEMTGTWIDIKAPAGQKFLRIEADIGLTWGGAEDQDFKLPLSQVLVADSRGTAAQFYALCSEDGSHYFEIPDVYLHAVRRYGQNSVRLSAIWLVPTTENRFVLTVGKSHQALSVKPDRGLKRDQFMDVKVLATSLVDSLDVDVDKQFARPQINGTLLNPNGKLLVVDFSMTPRVSNGFFGQAENMTHLKDFGLLAGGNYVRPAGVITEFKNQYVEEFGYSSNKTEGAFPTWKARMVFPVAAAPGAMKLTYLDVPVADLPPPK